MYVEIPKGVVYIIQLPFTLDNTNQLTFNSFSEQLNFFKSKNAQILNVAPSKEFNGKGVIRASGIYSRYDGYNYMMFQNTDYGNKWYFCYIDSYKQINQEVTELYYTLDLFQTFQFNFDIQSCYLERQHTPTDNLYDNTVSEGLETGEYLFGDIREITEMDKLGFIIGFSDDDQTSEDNITYGGLFGNIYSGVAYKYYTSAKSLTSFIRGMATNGKSDGIVTIYTVPQFVMDAYQDGEYLKDGSLTLNKRIEYSINLNNIDGYKPKNNKLYSYPYCFVSVSNNKGNNAVYRQEFFNINNPSFNPTFAFTLMGSITANSVTALIPRNYNRLDYNYDEKITLDGYPLCCWNNEVYANWLAQNKNTLQVNKACGVVNTVSSLVLNKSVTGALSNFESILKQNASVADKSVIPNHAEGNINSGDFNIANNLQHFIIRHATIRYEYAKRIDDFFTMFGYKVNSLTLPNYLSRKNHNYVKTSICSIKGKFPRVYKEGLENIFNNGVTFWHNPNTFGDYSQDNGSAY